MRSGRAPAQALAARQVQCLGALLLAVQVPQAYYMPPWAAGFGILLVMLRLWIERSAQRDRILRRLPSFALALVALATAFALKYHFGYFLGRDPCVAFLFVLVAIKFAEARTLRDGTLLICLATFLMITPFFYGQSLFAAVATLPAFILLASSLQLLAPPASINGRTMPFRDPLRRSVRLLLEGLPLALLLFVGFPRLSAPLWGLPSDFSAKSGLSDSMQPGMISALSLSDAVAFRVDFSDVMPPPRQRYWRGPVFTRFDGRQWTGSPRRATGRLAPGHGASTIVYTVTLEPHFKNNLFALDLPAVLPRMTEPTAEDAPDALAMLTPDQQLIARNIVSQPLRYMEVSYLRDHYPEAIDTQRLADRADALELPRGNPRTKAFARELRTSNPDDAAFVAAVLAWFRQQPFYYTLTPPLLEGETTDRFLFDSRRGFCEHYAGAFVVLLRAAGIPARVVTGYQGGEVNPNGGYLIVRQSDAHAWAEALIDGEWRRFDPTAAVAPSRIALGLGGALPAEDRVPLFARINEGWFKGFELAWDAVNHDWRRHVVGFNFLQQKNLWRYWQMDQWAAWQLVLAGALLTAAWAAGLLLWFALRHYQRDDRVATMWNGLCRRLAHAGLPREPHEGPLAYSARAALRWPAFAAAFAVIGESYAALRYGRLGSAPDLHTEQTLALDRLGHAIAILPRPRTLRASKSM